jgi:CheY-like chemotaxis protein
VLDTGIGIPPGKLGEIFEAFTQADGSHTRRFGGTGLGLAITRRLIDLMGGRIWAKSTLGRGSVFSFELPLREGAQSVEPETLPAQQTPLTPLRVLVAEDNPVNQTVIHAVLQRQGWAVTMAPNGREAWENFRQGAFDLVLMDVQMPEMDGLEATRLIREEERRRGSGGRIPILALTAHAASQDCEECLAHGMDGVITKPVSPPILLGEIRAALIGVGGGG